LNDSNYSQPILIRILSKNPRNKIMVSIVDLVDKDNDKDNNNCDICEILKRFGINYNFIKSNFTQELNHNYIILNFKNEDKFDADSHYNLIEHILKKVTNDSKIIISFNKKKVLEQVMNIVTTKHKITTIDYYIDHSKTNNEFYCVINI